VEGGEGRFRVAWRRQAERIEAAALQEEKMIAADVAEGAQLAAIPSRRRMTAVEYPRPSAALGKCTAITETR
jgi:hypothetical protein